MKYPFLPSDLVRNGDAEARSWHRALTASALACCQRQNPAAVLRGLWPSDGRAAAIVTRTPQVATGTGDGLGHDPVSTFQSLAPSSAAARLFALAVKFDMAGISTIRVPLVSALPPTTVFVGEDAPAGNVQWTMTSTTVGPVKKFLVLSAVTSDVEAATPGTASAVIASVLGTSCSKSLDKTAFDASPADATRPAGLLHSVTPIGAAPAGGNALATDLAALAGAIAASGIDAGDCVYVCGAREASIIKTTVGPRFDSPILVTLGLAPKTIACFAPSAVFTGTSGLPEIETSRESAYHFEDTAPTDISTAGTPPAVAAPTRSLFQTDVIGIRVRLDCCWAVAAGAVQFVSGVNW